MREYALEAGGQFKAVNETFVEHWVQVSGGSSWCLGQQLPVVVRVSREPIMHTVAIESVRQRSWALGGSGFEIFKIVFQRCGCC